MKDIIVAAIVFGAVPFILMRPYVGVLVWAWLGYMNPHRLAYGFAYNFPFAQVVAIVTLVGLITSKEPKRIPWSATTVAWFALVLWMSITTAFALNAAEATPAWIRTLKVQFMVLMTLLVITDRERITWLVWMIAASLGFYGVKGGLFSIATAGNYRVWGPEGTYIGGNNELALALIMILPLMRYLQTTTNNRWIRYGLIAAMLLTGLAILSSYSRGALLAATCMLLWLWIKSRRKLLTGAVLGVLAAMGLAFMPQQWTDRMETVKTYEQDGSAMGRITAWEFAFDLASARFLGGGYEAFIERNYRDYSPQLVDKIVNYADGRFQGPHSIYFQILGEHGFVGLLLYLLLGFLTYRNGTWIISRCKEREDLRWASDLASMLQVSIIGFAIGGAFLALAYFDLPYHVMTLLVLIRIIVANKLEGEKNTGDVATQAHRPRPPGLGKFGVRTLGGK